MSRTEAFERLSGLDPARSLNPVSVAERSVLYDRIVTTPATREVSKAGARRRLITIGVAVAAAAVMSAGIAWAAGTWSPRALFEANPQHANGGAGALWDQQVVAGSVREAATVELPHVGTVRLWYGDTVEHGWCAACSCRAETGLAPAKDPQDAGGTVPGCFPTREQVNGAGSSAVYVINGFDYEEGDVDARSHGGAFWRIRYGRVTVPNATRVVDSVSGRSVPVVHDDLFMLAIPDANPDGRIHVHLVAYSANGKIVGDDSTRP